MLANDGQRRGVGHTRTGAEPGEDSEVDDSTLPKWRMYINVRASDIAARPGMLSGGDRAVLLTGREQRQGPQV